MSQKNVSSRYKRSVRKQGLTQRSVKSHVFLIRVEVLVLLSTILARVTSRFYTTQNAEISQHHHKQTQIVIYLLLDHPTYHFITRGRLLKNLIGKMQKKFIENLDSITRSVCVVQNISKIGICPFY